MGKERKRDESVTVMNMVVKVADEVYIRSEEGKFGPRLEVQEFTV
jgi:hypothetical protein